jgi:hypothetical protein
MLCAMTSVARGVRSLLPAALCALAAHAAVYGTLVPSDGVHGYFGWYEPLVAGLSLTSAALVLALALAARLGRARRPARAIQRFLPTEEGGGLALPAVRLSRAALAFFFLQETLERSIAWRSLEPATLRPSAWCLVLVVVVACAWLLVLAGRGGQRLLRGAAAERVPRLRPVPAPGPVRACTPRRRRPLALGRGLRAPPLLAG